MCFDLDDIVTSYSESDLQYLYFTHSLYMLSSLLCYQQGRDFFPIKAPEKKGMYVAYGLHYTELGGSGIDEIYRIQLIQSNVHTKMDNSTLSFCL